MDMTIFKKLKSQQGFTLVEILISLVVFSIGIMAVTMMQGSSMKLNTHSGSITEATSLARSKMEDLLNRGYDDADLKDTNTDSLAGLSAYCTDTADFHETSGRYDIYWNVAEDQPVNNAKTIQVFVKWTLQSGTKNVSFASIKAR